MMTYLARLFGQRVVTHHDYYWLIGYRWRGRIYVWKVMPETHA